MNWQEDIDDDWDDESSYDDSDEDEPTRPCPYCGVAIHEELPRCPHCESYVSQEDSLPARKPVWILITAIVCLLAAIACLIGF